MLITTGLEHFLSLNTLGRMQRISAAEAIHTLTILVPPGTHHCWVDRGGADSNLAQRFYTLHTLQESNPRPIELLPNALTTRPRTPQYI